MLAFLFFFASSEDKRLLVFGQTTDLMNFNSEISEISTPEPPTTVSMAMPALDPSPEPMPTLPNLDAQPDPFAAPADDKEGGSISQQLPLVEPFAPKSVKPFTQPPKTLPPQKKFADPPFFEPFIEPFIEPAPRVLIRRDPPPPPPPPPPSLQSSRC